MSSRMFLWDHTHDMNNSFKPNYFIQINIDRKVKAYKALTSQVRSFRSPEMLEQMASLRGKQSGYEYAEAYKILRWVE